MASSVLPNDFLERVSTLYPLSLHPNILSTFSAKRPIVIRVNTLLTDRESVLDEIRKAGVVLRDVAWYQDAFVTDSFDAKALTSLPLYKEGKIYIQNLSSMIPPLVMDIKKGDTILDLCAAPGSKTSQIATFLSGTGELVACDKSRDRLFKLQANLKQQGVTEVKLVLKPGEIVWKWYPEYFDAVLVDVPCSMEGRITTLDLDSFKDWSKKKIKVLAKIQKNLLRAGVSSAKVGGVIVYSTCTLSPEENEEVIEWILQREKGAVVVESIQIKGLEMKDGLTMWQGKVFDDSLAKTKRVVPSETMEGFFVAKLRKVKSTVPSLLSQIA